MISLVLTHCQPLRVLYFTLNKCYLSSSCFVLNPNSSDRSQERGDVGEWDVIDNSIRRLLETILLNIYLSLSRYTCSHVWVLQLWHVCGDQRTTLGVGRFFLSTLWLLHRLWGPKPNQRLLWQTLRPLSHLSSPRISCWNHLCPALSESISYKTAL